MVFVFDGGITARTMPVLGLFLRLVDDVGRYDACGYGNDGITQKHDEGRKQTSDGSNWGDVTIAYGSHRHNSPIDGGSQIGELCIGLTTLNHKHQRSQTSDQYQYKQEIDGYFGQTLLEGVHQDITLVDETEQLEDAEDTDECLLSGCKYTQNS